MATCVTYNGEVQDFLHLSRITNSPMVFRGYGQLLEANFGTIS